MLTLYYVAATWLQSWRLSSTLAKLRNVFHKNGSLAVHQELPPYIYMSGAVPQQKLEVDSVLSRQCINHNTANVGDLLWFCGNKKMVSIFPKQLLDISGWISVIPGRTHLPVQIKNKKVLNPKDKLYVLLEVDYNTCQYLSCCRSLEIENYGVPVAWHVGVVMSLLLETDETNLALLCVAFQNDVTLENGIQIIRIETVDVVGHPYKIQNVGTVPETYAPLNPGLDKAQLKECFMSRWRAHVSMLCTFCDAVQQVKDMGQEISVRHPGSGVGAVRLVPSIPPVIESPRKSSVEEITTETSTDDCNVNTTQAEPSTPSSGVSISHLSTDTMMAAGSTRLADSLTTTSMSSLRSLPSTPRRTISTSISDKPVKPPNIIVFSDSSSSADIVKTALETTLQPDRYTFHVLSCAEAKSQVWFNHASLVVVHGNVPPDLTPVIIDYILTTDGSVLCLCSDLLGSILPVFRTAEVRPNELVHCSYKSWKHVPLMHHVFCYQPAPSAPHFSHDDQNNLSAIPASVDLKDKEGKIHKLKVEVLGVEETWQTPSLLLVSSGTTSAKIVFSQVHLEIEPSQYEIDGKNSIALQESDKARLEILSDVLGHHLGLSCCLHDTLVTYTPAYFLGNHEIKLDLLNKLTSEGYLDNNSLKCGDISLKFCGKGVVPTAATSSQLPVLMHACPESFSTVEYFENLTTDSVGRLVLYCETLTSSMAIVQGPSFQHGFTVIPQRQTKGVGRGNNTWLSPEGCAMFTIQLHIPLDSYLGQHLPFVQLLCSLAVVAAICQLQGLEDLDIGLKWPNDIYAFKSTKIGGLVVTSTIESSKAVCNIGCGLNLSNKEPTVCTNELIVALNNEIGGKAQPLSPEKYFAIVFNKIEELYNMAQCGNIEDVYSLYYNYWLHTGAEIEVLDSNGSAEQVKVKGIDSFGYLTVQTHEGKDIVIQPDGNSFDMMAGLVFPKLK